MPPCLSHDIFEGVISYDVSVYLKYFIKTIIHWLIVALSNLSILLQIPGQRPAEVCPKGDELRDQAVQNWCLLRLLPLLTGDKITDSEDKCMATDTATKR